ncbi:MAG: hypothetical protein QXT79_02230 [Thermofilaceae archaeon]
MAFDHLKPKPATRITTAWGHALIDALNLFYDWLTTGERDVRVASVDAAYGYFSEQVLVKGRPVIKDGDPITIYDIYDAARIRITEAIDAARSTLYLSLLYGKFNGMFMDAYGRVGVAIYDDRIGLAKSSDVAAVRDRLPSSLTTAGNLRTAIMEDAVGIARDSTLAAVRDRLPSSLTTAGNLRIAVVEDTVGLAKSTDVSAIQPRNIARWGGTTLTGRDITQDIAKLQNLDVALSTRASESTLSGVKAQTDKLTFDASNRLYVNAAVVANPPNLDVALSTRASESTLTAVRDRLPSSLTTAGNLRTAVMEDAVGLARDSTVAAVRDRLPSSLTSAGNFKAAVVEDGVGLAKESTLSSILGRLDVALSTRASESTLGGIKSQTDRLTFDASNRLYVNAAVVANPPNLDVALSTRASESTLAAVRDRLPSSLTTAGNLRMAVMEDAVGLAKSSDVAAVRDRLPSSLTAAGNFRAAVVEDTVGLARDSTVAAVRDRLPSSLTSAGNLRTAIMEDAVGLARDSTLSSILNRLDVALSSRLSESTFTARVPVLSTQTLDIGGSAYAALNVVPSIGGDISRMPYTIDNIPVTTTESSVAIAPPGAKLIRITNKGDVDCLVGVNGPVPASNPLRVRAGCSVTFPFRGATSIYYRTERDSTVISITYFN